MPDDPIIDKMDPFLRLWMFYNWIEDQNDDVELVKNHAYLLGSFWNPEAVAKLTGNDSNASKSTDEEFEASTNMMRMEMEKEEINNPKRKRRRKIQG